MYNPGHRVSRPRGTGSVGDSVGEGQPPAQRTQRQGAWQGQGVSGQVTVPVSGQVTVPLLYSTLM